VTGFRPCPVVFSFAPLAPNCTEVLCLTKTHPRSYPPGPSQLLGSTGVSKKVSVRTSKDDDLPLYEEDYCGVAVCVVECKSHGAHITFFCFSHLCFRILTFGVGLFGGYKPGGTRRIFAEISGQVQWLLIRGALSKLDMIDMIFNSI